MPSVVHHRPHVTFVSTVHPHPWAPRKGTFNRTMLRGLAAHLEVSAVIPVPWTERRTPRHSLPDTGYPLDTPTWWYLPRLAPLRLARALERSLGTALTARSVPDIVLSYWADPDGTAALAWARRINRPFALIVGGSDLMVLAASPARGERIVRTIRDADLVLAVGSRIHDELLARGIDPARVQRFRRGVDRALFRPGDRDTARATLQLPRDRPVILWVGRMVAVKGLEHLLIALTNPALRGLNPLLALVGDGPLRRRLATSARRLGIASDVRFVGAVGAHALPTWYAAANVVALPSLSEGVPNVLLEAAACGRPFVASDVGGIRDVTDDPERDLVPPADAARLAERLAERLTTPQVAPAIDVPDAAASAGWLADRLREAIAGRPSR